MIHPQYRFLFGMGVGFIMIGALVLGLALRGPRLSVRHVNTEVSCLLVGMPYRLGGCRPSLSSPQPSASPAVPGWLLAGMTKHASCCALLISATAPAAASMLYSP